MKYQSEEFSIRVQDALMFNAIISEIYFVMHDKFAAFLPFYDENIKDLNINFIKQQTLLFLDFKGIPEKIFSIYVNNTKFFNEKYSLTEDMFSKKTVKEKGNIILKKMIDDVQIMDVDSNILIDSIIFGKNKQNIIECPIIVQDSFDIFTYISPTQDGKMSSLYYNFKTTKNTSIFKKIYNKIQGTDVQQILPSFSKYYFDKAYFQQYADFLEYSGFHFERFVSFDFEPSQFINFIKNKQELNDLCNQSEIEEFFFSCLNTSFFLGDNNNSLVRNIKINRQAFKKLFPIGVEPQANDPNATKNYNTLLKYLPAFMTNICHGLRLVWRNFDIVEGDKSQTNLNYNTDISSDIGFFSKKTFISNNQSLEKNFSSYPQYKNLNKDQTTLRMSSLEYNIIKEKSYILFFEEGSGSAKKIFRKVLIPVSTVYGQKKYGGDFSIQSLHNFVDDKQNTSLDNLIEQIKLEKEFKEVFDKIIPVKYISTIYNMSKTTILQNDLNSTLALPISDINRNAKILQQSINNTLNILLKDPKEY